MKRLILFLLVLVLALAAFAGCTPKEEPADVTKAPVEEKEVEATEEPKEEVEATEEPKEEVSLTFVFAGGDPLAKSLLEERVDVFNDMYPHITIIPQPSSSGGYLDFVKTKDAVGEFPDMLECRDVQVFEEKLAELPAEIVEMLDDPATLNGKNYVAPLSKMLTSIGCYYDKALFDELGLEEPTTYDEFLSLCQTIQDSGTSPIVQGGKDLWHTGFWWSNFWIKNVASKNPDFIADRYVDEVSFADEDVKLALQQYADLYQYIDKGWASTGDNQLVSFLVSGKAAMFFSGSWMVGQVTEADPDFDLGWFPVPDVDGELRMLGGSQLAGLALSKEAAQDSNKVEAFNAFVKFFYSDEQYAPYLSAISFGPATVDPPEVEYASDLIQEFAEAGSKAVFVDLNWNSKWGDNLLPGAFRNFAYKAFQDMVANGTTVDELCEVLDQQWAVEVALLED